MKKEFAASSRKKFLLWGALAIGATALGRFLPGNKKEEKPATIKMLAEDGSLVEIDEALLGSGKKITNTELQTWIKNKPGQ
jgi:hypothetical protein